MTTGWSPSTAYKVGDRIVVSHSGSHLPGWVMKRPWQDGDRAIVLWFYKLVGWKLPTFDGDYTITAVH
jgi:hypothetical protein